LADLRHAQVDDIPEPSQAQVLKLRESAADASLGFAVANSWIYRRRELRDILQAWALGDTDKMAALMLSAFLREFGKAPEVTRG
jgi:hypothetical protein